MVRTIDDINVADVEKRKIPSKHYVYVIYVTWSDGSVNTIYRRYSRFFDFQSSLMETYPEEAGLVDPSKRIIPFLPGKKFFGRSHIREVAVKRLGPIADYCKQIVKLPQRISQCKEVLEFFEMDMDDMNPQKGKKASIKAKKISTPKPLEVYVACTDYKKQEKGEVTLKIGMLVEVVEKTETGWWFVNADEEQGWVPSTCLQREDGEREETSTRFAPGQEEQYLSTEEFVGEGEDELSMERGAVVDVVEKNLEGWWLVRYNGREGYVPATYLMKTEAFHVRKKPDLTRTSSGGPTVVKPSVARTASSGPQIVKSLHEVSDLLKDDKVMAVDINIDDNAEDDTYNMPDDFDEDPESPAEEEEQIYTIHEIGRILRENKRGDTETDKINQSINKLKSRSLTRGGSIRPPPRPSIKPKFGEKSPSVEKPVLTRLDSLSQDYVTIADFSDSVGDGISFTSGQHVRVLEKSEGGWWFIQIEGQEGWAPASYIEQANGGNQPNSKPEPAPTPVKLTSSSGAAPPPPPQTNKSNLRSSQEDLTKDDQKESPKSARKSSTIEGLKGALKAKLPHKDKGPPTPPKKDFLNDDQSEKPSMASGTSMQLPVKPGLPKKTPDRGNLHAPPPPPSTSKPDVKTDSRPVPPVKVKSEKISSSEEEEEEHRATNVAGLAGALKARFESKAADKPKPALPSATQKPKMDPKPTPPSLSQKPTPPSSTQKPTPPNATQKPTLPSSTHKPTPPISTQKPTLPKATQKPTSPKSTKPQLNVKPTPPAFTQKPQLERKPAHPKVESNKPVLNKVEFPAGGPKSPGSLSLAPGNASKPAWAKHEKDSANKPSWVKSDSETSSKPSWAKHNDNTSNKPSSTSAKPSWVKNDNDSATKSSAKPSLAKPTPSKSPKPTWAKPDIDSNKKPSWAKPDIDSDKKPSWVKPDVDSRPTSAGHTGVGSSAGKVSDLASVLKSKLENKGKSESDSCPVTSSHVKHDNPPPLPSTNNKPVMALKPKPDRPSAPPTPPTGRRSKKLDPSKYSARPLPPKPAKDPATDGDPNTNKKPLPSIPGKGRQSSSDSDSDDNVRPAGVSGLANVLKAKLGNQKSPSSSNDNIHTTEIAFKPLPSVPVKTTTWNVSASDTENNNKPTPEIVLNAIADYNAENDGEMSLVIGQQYELLDKADGWWYVSSGSSEGWAPADYLEHSREPGRAATQSQTGPSTNGGGGRAKQAVFRTCSDFSAENEGELSVPRDQEVTVIENPEGGWWFVQYGGAEGWIPEAYLQQA